jgi:hypothetical protein
MNRTAIISQLVDGNFYDRHVLDQCDDTELNDFVAAANRRGARIDSGYRVARADGGQRHDGDAKELAELMRHFDAAPNMLENYASADPWLNGEEAAWHAAGAATGRADGRQPSATYAGFDRETAAAMSNFDQVMLGAARGDYAPNANPSSAAGVGGGFDPAIVGQARHLASLSEEEYAELSDDARAAVDEILRAAVERIEAIRGASTAQLAAIRAGSPLTTRGGT